MCITRLHNFCIYEGCIKQSRNETGFITSEIHETFIAANSVLWDIIVQELAQRALERQTSD